jgi:hypothetical protein
MEVLRSDPRGSERLWRTVVLPVLLVVLALKPFLVLLAVGHGSVFEGPALSQLRVGDVGPSQGSPSQVGLAQVGPAQIGPAQVEFSEVGTVEMNNAPVLSDQTRLIQELHNTGFTIAVKSWEHG